MDILNDLASLEDASRASVAEPARPTSQAIAGAIDAISIDPEGLIWAAGWKRRDVPAVSSLVILDGKKFPGAISAVCYDDPNLPEDCHAIVATISTSWRPRDTTREVFLFFAPSMERCLRTKSPLTTISGEEIVRTLTGVEGRVVEGDLAGLRSTLLGIRSWITSSEAAAGLGVRAHVDELMVLPGFGAFVDGWTVSSIRQVTSIAVRLGRRVLTQSLGGIYFTPRSDLSGVPGATPDVLERAGFVAALEGSFSSADIFVPVMKVGCADGSTANFQIDVDRIRRVGEAIPPEAALRLFPSLAKETFFPRFAAALRRDLIDRLQRADEVSPLASNSRILVVDLPPTPSDARLLADQLGSNLREARDLEIVLVGNGRHRSALPALADALRRQTSLHVGAVVADSRGKSLFLLPSILRSTGADRFALVAQGAFLNRQGWASCIAALSAPDGGAKTISASNGQVAAVVWTSRAFSAWTSQAVIPLGARHLTVLLNNSETLAGDARTLNVERPDLVVEDVDSYFLKGRVSVVRKGRTR